MYVYRLAVERLDPMDRQAIPAAEGIGGEDRGGGGRRSLLESGGVVWAGEFGCGLLGVALRVPPPPPVSSQPPAGLAGEHFIAAGGGVPVLMPVVAPAPLDADPTAVKE